MSRVFTALTLWLTACSTGFAGEISRPNILFILADDQAEWAMGCSGHPSAKTPSLDRLAREGVRLTNCFTPTPVCSPSRVAILTSRYGTEVGIFDWLNPKLEPEHGLDPAIPAWPALLADVGYRTGLVGKWHLGLQEKYHPSKFGYQYFMGFLEGGTTPRDPQLVINGSKQTVPGYVVDLVAEDALKFLEREPGRPFALSVHFREPHAPYTPLPETESTMFATAEIQVPDPDFPGLDHERVKQLTRDYLGSVAAVDRNVGRLLDQLDRLNLTQNTIVVFSSDHGYNIGHHGIHHKGNATWLLKEKPPATPNIPAGFRPNMFDTSLRVPALIRWPQQLPASTVISRTVTHLDWLPTILEAAGAKLPAGTVVRGHSMLPLLQNREDSSRSDDFYFEYSVRHTMRADMRSFRTARWKLTRDFLNPGRDELYDLAADPGETVNLAASEQPEAQAALNELTAAIRENMEMLKDPILKDQ